MAASNLHENHRARMQARVERDGLESLAEHEALEYLLYLSIPRMDTNELALAEWFARENIPVEDDGISLTREMIRVFKHGE